MLSVLIEGGAALGYGYIGEHNVDLIAALSDQPPDCSGLMTDDDLQRIVDGLADRLASASGTSCNNDDCESEEDMPQIIKIGGVAYLVNNCGCSDSEFYRLDRAAVQIDDTTGAASITENDTGGVDGLQVKADYKSCVAGRVVPYMLQLTTNYQSLLVELLAHSIDILTSWDEVLETATLAGAWLSGDADLVDISEFVTSSVQDALADTAYQETMLNSFEAMWGGTEISRDWLRAWAETSQAYVGLVPVRLLLRDWAKYCNLTNLNEQLSRMHGACIGETDYDPFGDNPAPGYSEHAYDGKTYPMIVRTGLNIPLAQGVDWSPDLPDDISWGSGQNAFVVQVSSDAGNYDWNQYCNGAKFDGYTTSGDNQVIGCRSDADCLSAGLDATGWTLTQAVGTASTGATDVMCNWATGSDNLRITGFCVVGQALEDQS